MDLWIIFLTGLTVGGLTCVVVQGGLLASVIASNNGKDHVFPTLSFLVAKFISHIILGFLLGLFGSVLQLSDQARIIIQIFTGIYMIGIALNLLNIHPIFRYLLIQPPHFISKLIRDESKTKNLFAPAILGFFTILIPCGTTLAMEVLAISTGDPILGALILGIFVAGTSPLFFGLGYITSLLGSSIRKIFLKLAAILIIYLGFSSINGGLTLAGRPIEIPIEISFGERGQFESGSNVQVINGLQVANISVFPNGYVPNRIQVKQGLPVRLNLTTSGGYGCTSSFRIPTLQISKNLKINSSDYVEFIPNQKCKINWTCSMGMYTGVIEVI